MSEINPRPDPDAVALRARLARLLQALNVSRDHNPATLEALERIFPEAAPPKPLPQRGVEKIKQWFRTRHAA